jgi:hypothetical protein
MQGGPTRIPVGELSNSVQQTARGATYKDDPVSVGYLPAPIYVVTLNRGGHGRSLSSVAAQLARVKT